MRNAVRRTAAGTALAIALVACGGAAAAKPVSAGKVNAIVLQYYSDVVRVGAEPGPTQGTKIGTRFAPRDPGRQPFVLLHAGMLSEDQIAGLAGWLRGFESANHDVAFTKIWAEMMPVDKEKAERVLDQVKMVQVPIGANRAGLFTRGGQQLEEVEGGADPSYAQFTDTVLEAVASESPADSLEIATDALIDLLQDLSTSIEPPLSDADTFELSDADTLELREDLETSIAASRLTEDPSHTARFVSTDDLQAAYRTLGIETEMVIDGDMLTVLDRATNEVIADGLELAPPSGATRQLTLESLNELNRQDKEANRLEEVAESAEQVQASREEIFTSEVPEAPGGNPEDPNREATGDPDRSEDAPEGEAGPEGN